MKVKVTLELEIEDDLDDRGSIDLAVDEALLDLLEDYGDVRISNENLWEEYKITWEVV